MVDGRALCDLDYVEDSNAEVDANVVMTGDGGLVEVQATAERTPLSRTSLDELLALAEGGIARLREVQERIGSVYPRHRQPPQAGGDERNCCRGSSWSRCPTGFELPPENGESFEANALIKARAAHVATGGAVIADDSGIEAEDLGGAPGIYSARYAGIDVGDEVNLDKLLREVDAAGGNRRAAYVCVLALIDDDGTEQIFEGALRGPAA